MGQSLLTVVICTYNRSNLLKLALTSLEDQSIDQESFEVIVVDNNSTDDTSNIAKKICDRYSTWRYVFEKKQGLSHARNRGIKEARGRYIGYLDDDGKASKHWVKTALNIMENEKPDVFGGPYYAFYNSSKPDWWKDEYRSNEPSTVPRSLKEGEYVNGGNMFFKKELLKELGGFKTDLGMQGEKIAMGEETELQMRIRKQYPNKKIFSDPKLYIYHLVHEKKMSLKWIVKHKFYDGRSSSSVFDGDNNSMLGSIFKVFYYSGKLIYDITLGSLIRDKDKYPYYQNYWYEVALPNIKKLGQNWKN